MSAITARRRVLMYAQNFAPELISTGKYTADMARWLAEAGHDVRVITAPPHYPDWRIGAGYRNGRYTREAWHGVRVDRAPLWVPRAPNGGRRLLHHASFAVASLPLLLKNVAWRPHVVLCVAPALACAPGAALIARLTGALSWLHIQDFEVDAAFGLGLLQGKALRATAIATERVLLRSFDRVSTISRPMRDRLLDKGVADDRALLVPNWVDTDEISPMTSATSYRGDLGIPEGAFVALYSGTMAAKQGMELLGEAVRRVASREHIHFIFCGQGPGRENLRAACEGAPRVHWLALQPAERLPELLNTADLHLLPQQRAAADLVLPSKLTGMLASGRPILATADPGTELARWVDGCGQIVAPGDGTALGDALLALSFNRHQCLTYGAHARQRALERLSRNSVLAGFCSDLEDALEGRRNAVPASREA